ncbi:MAG: hypothetical protein LBK03_07620 [Bacteroidales bacterium]|jgi:hypothetical protein|nr:hypothetical protein [Bacteroidales bacterium]
MKKLSLFIAIAFISHSILAQEFCEKLLKDGIAAYDSRNYIEAMRLFSQGMNENNKCNTAVFREWIQACYDKMNTASLRELAIITQTDTTFSNSEVLLCNTLMNKGKVEFDGKNFEKAKMYFLLASDNNCFEANSWISLCNQQLTQVEPPAATAIETTITSAKPETGSSAKASIIKVWQEHNAVENNVYGMRIHINFMAKNMLNQQGNCTVWFYFANGNKLMDVNSNYSASDGQVAASKNFTPTYINSKYSDFMIFMPYSELHCPTDARQDLKFKVGIFDNDNNQLITSDFFRFSIGAN